MAGSEDEEWGHESRMQVSSRIQKINIGIDDDDEKYKYSKEINEVHKDNLTQIGYSGWENGIY